MRDPLSPAGAGRSAPCRPDLQGRLPQLGGPGDLPAPAGRTTSSSPASCCTTARTCCIRSSSSSSTTCCRGRTSSRSRSCRCRATGRNWWPAPTWTSSPNGTARTSSCARAWPTSCRRQASAPAFPSTRCAARSRNRQPAVQHREPHRGLRHRRTAGPSRPATPIFCRFPVEYTVRQKILFGYAGERDQASCHSALRAGVFSQHLPHGLSPEGTLAARHRPSGLAARRLAGLVWRIATCCSATARASSLPSCRSWPTA